MRIACWIASATFCLFSYWQLNDREQYGTELWWAWVLLYAATALISLISSIRPLPTSLVLAGSALAALAAGVRVLAVDWQGPLLFDESNPAANETGGLLVVCLWLGFIGWRFAGAKDSSR